MAKGGVLLCTCLLVVDGLASEFLLHQLLRDAVVVNARFLPELKAMELAAQRLEQGAAAGPRPAEHNQQLAALEQSVEAVQDLLRLLLPEAEELSDSERRHQKMAHSLLDLDGRAGAVDVEVAKGDAAVSRLHALLAQLLYKVPKPLVEVKALMLWIQGRVVLVDGRELGVGSCGDRDAGTAARERRCDADQLGAIIFANHLVGIRVPICFGRLRSVQRIGGFVRQFLAGCPHGRSTGIHVLGVWGGGDLIDIRQLCHGWVTRGPRSRDADGAGWRSGAPRTGELR